MNLSDFERPLNKRGLKAAPFMGELMRSRGYIPQVVISSPAMRARQTAEMAVAAGEFGDIIQFEPRIYESSPQTLLNLAGQIDDQFSAAMLVGHNPGMESFVRILTGDSESMPTAALAVIELNIDSWADIHPGAGTLREFIKPKHLMSPKK